MLQILTLFGILQKKGVTLQFHPLLGPREGKGYASTFEFVSFVGDVGDRRHYVAIPPKFCPTSRQGLHSYF